MRRIWIWLSSVKDDNGGWPLPTRQRSALGRYSGLSFEVAGAGSVSSFRAAAV